VTAVYYSLTCDANGPTSFSGRGSVDSLRRHNREHRCPPVPLRPARANTLQAAERAGVRILAMGNYAEAFGDIPEHWRRALSRYPTMHKLLSLRRFAAEPALDELNLPRLRHVPIRRRGQLAAAQPVPLVCPRRTRQHPQPLRL